MFCDLPDIDATTSAGRMLLTMMASVAEFEALRISARTREALASVGMCDRPMAQALAGVGKLSSTGQPLAPAQLGRILQRLALAGKPQGGDLRLVAA